MCCHTICDTKNVHSSKLTEESVTLSHLSHFSGIFFQIKYFFIFNIISVTFVTAVTKRLNSLIVN